MKRATRSVTITWLTCLSLALSLGAGILVTDKAEAKSGDSPKQSKVASDLNDQVRRNGQATVKVIIQLNDKMSGPLNSLLRGNGVRVKKQYVNFNAFAVELPANVVDSLTQFTEVEFVSVDSDVQSFGHVSHTTGADSVRSLASTGALDGNGIGIAVLDSGIYSSHVSFRHAGTTNTRIVANVDFTGEGRTDDPYGHGTHVAAAALGNGAVSNGKYIGIAPKANLVNLRVLNSQGIGSVSGLLSALDWVMTNRTTYNIRVVNMSLGLPAVSSYKNDPVCQASRGLVNAGLVVVAAAGNNGKNGAGQKIYGAIHSPGNEPSVITVGAVDTKGTDNRADDSIATYSSRGPTRSYWTDTIGVKHFDNQIKPDLSAPGNKTIFAESPNNLLVQQNPSLDLNVSANVARDQMSLSGTSMASPIIAGAAALLLQANPNLTPNMVKMLLMYTAQQLPNYNMFEQGAGELNLDGAVRMAKVMRTDQTALTTVGTSLLTAAAPTPQSSISYGDDHTCTFSWSQGVILGNTFATGTPLLTQYQKVYGLGVLLGDAVILSNGVLIGDATKMSSSGVLLGDSIKISNGTTMSGGGYFCASGVLLGDGVLLSDGVLIGDGVLLGDGVLIGDGVLLGDAIAQASSAMLGGDPTDSMSIEVDTGVDYLGY